MEHSVEKYLERQSTQKLKVALQSYLQQGKWVENRQIVLLILDTLRGRGVDVSEFLEAE